MTQVTVKKTKKEVPTVIEWEGRTYTLVHPDTMRPKKKEKVNN